MGPGSGPSCWAEPFDDGERTGCNPEKALSHLSRAVELGGLDPGWPIAQPRPSEVCPRTRLAPGPRADRGHLRRGFVDRGEADVEHDSQSLAVRHAVLVRSGHSA